MRFDTVLAPEAGRASGPDLTRYLVVCAATIAALLFLAWVFRRFVAGHVQTRAAKRSLQVLDVLPLSGKQKLVVVRCYERSFLLGVGEKEVRAIAELDPVPPTRAAGPGPSFSAALEGELVLQPAPAAARPATAAQPTLGSREGVLA